MTIKIDGLTNQDIELLDYMWSIDSEEDLHRWINKQPPSVKNRCLTLVQLAVMASVEDEGDEMDTTVAKLMLISIGVNC